MLSEVSNKIRKKNAEFARDVEYIKETAYEDMIDARTEMAESMYEGETFDEIREAMEMAERLPGEEDVNESAEEIDRILNADHDLSFMEMAGIEV